MRERPPTPPRSPPPRSWRCPPASDPADVAATYAERNDAILNDCVCAAGTSDATVTVSIVVDGFLLVTGPKTVTARARAVVDMPGEPPPT